MAPPKLKIRPLPDKTPSKLTIAIEPDLQSELETYAAVYRQTYGEDASIAALIPHMLRSFLAGDVGFRRARKTLPQSTPQQGE